MQHKLSLILPCLNEAEAIPRVLKKLLDSREEILARSDVNELEVIVVNDGSTDDSLERLQAFSNDISIVSHARCEGYGTALKTGFEAATGDLLGFYDLDDTCQPLDIIPMLNALTRDNMGLVCGNRLQNDTQMPMTRWIGNTIYKSITGFLLNYPVGDCCSGYRVFHARYKRQFIEQLPEDLNFSLAMTISFLRQKQNYLEVPIRYRERLGPSKLNPFIHGPIFLATLLKFCLSPRYSAKGIPSTTAS